MIRYGIYGMASISPRFIKGIELSENGEVGAICTSNKKKQIYEGITYYDTYEELLKDETIDVIYIPTPNYLHYDHMLKALKAKKHVVCEKPFTLTTSQAKQVFEYAKKQHCFVMEAQKIIFLPITNWLKYAIDEQVIGRVEKVEISLWFEEGKDKTHWMYDDAKGGGVLYGSASYVLEYMMYLFNTHELKHIHADRLIGETGVDEVVDFSFYVNGILVEAHYSRKMHCPSEAVFIGSKGKVIVPYFWKAEKAQTIINNEETEIKIPFESEFLYEVSHINHCLMNGYTQSPIMNKDMTLASVKAVELMKHKEV